MEGDITSGEYVSCEKGLKNQEKTMSINALPKTVIANFKKLDHKLRLHRDMNNQSKYRDAKVLKSLSQREKTDLNRQ